MRSAFNIADDIEDVAGDLEGLAEAVYRSAETPHMDLNSPEQKVFMFTYRTMLRLADQLRELDKETRSLGKRPAEAPAAAE